MSTRKSKFSQGRPFALSGLGLDAMYTEKKLRELRKGKQSYGGRVKIYSSSREIHSLNASWANQMGWKSCRRSAIRVKGTSICRDSNPSKRSCAPRDEGQWDQAQGGHGQRSNSQGYSCGSWKVTEETKDYNGNNRNIKGDNCTINHRHSDCSPTKRWVENRYFVSADAARLGQERESDLWRLCAENFNNASSANYSKIFSHSSRRTTNESAYFNMKGYVGHPEPTPGRILYATKITARQCARYSKDDIMQQRRQAPRGISSTFSTSYVLGTTKKNQWALQCHNLIAQ